MSPAASKVRVRFAPSPTGYLHIGGVRTALYNWLWARQNNGAFILRIEDTDRERSTEAAVEAIFESMRWLGLDWDEGPQAKEPHGPYFQTQRLAIYQEQVAKLISSGHAYRCYCTAEDLQKARAEHKARTGAEHGFRYPGTCRKRTDQPDQPFVVRFKAPETGVIGWDDLIKGRIEVAAETQQDAVLIRGNGIPLYNLGAVVDDITMDITLVARADDHVVNTPIQILLYQALGASVPQLAHMPLILAPTGEKLSKRHASVAAIDYRELGYLPDGLLNYLVRLGWSHGDQEIFKRSELIEKFNWEHVGKTGAKWDQKKLSSVQSEHLRAHEPSEIAKLALRFVQARGLTVDDEARLTAACALVMPRASTLVEVADGVDYFFREQPVMDDKAVAKLLVPAAAPVLDTLVSEIKQAHAFDRHALEARVKAWSEQSGIALKDIAQPARVALTGRSATPGLFEVMEVLGKERTLARLEQGATRARG
jgi:glutamyl-tRNA synthetase